MTSEKVGHVAVIKPEYRQLKEGHKNMRIGNVILKKHVSKTIRKVMRERRVHLRTADRILIFVDCQFACLEMPVSRTNQTWGEREKSELCHYGGENALGVSGT